MFFGFLHTLVMRKIKKSQKDFCEQEINYVTRIESSSNMEDQSDEDVCCGHQKNSTTKWQRNNSTPKLEMAQFQSSLPPAVIDLSLFFRRKEEKTKSPAHGAYCIPCVAWYVQDNFACSSPLAAFSQRGHLGGSHKFFHPTVGQTVQSVLTAR